MLSHEEESARRLRSSDESIFTQNICGKKFIFIERVSPERVQVRDHLAYAYNLEAVHPTVYPGDSKHAELLLLR
jgi:hypothetical protein